MPHALNEYILKEDAERTRQIAHRLERTSEKAERERLRTLHWMRCPRCGTEMHEVAYRGMTVDACFSCDGIFLSKAELAHLEKPGAHGVMSGILNWFRSEIEQP